MSSSISPVLQAADAILAAVRAVPYGQVCSYGAIARRAGFPRHARWVARVLASNQAPDLPWHRIVRADGRIAFAPGSSAFQTQCARLRAEGVKVCKGRVQATAMHNPAHDPAHAWLDEVLACGARSG